MEIFRKLENIENERELNGSILTPINVAETCNQVCSYLNTVFKSCVKNIEDCVYYLGMDYEIDFNFNVTLTECGTKICIIGEPYFRVDIANTKRGRVNICRDCNDIYLQTLVVNKYEQIINMIYEYAESELKEKVELYKSSLLSAEENLKKFNKNNLTNS